jgi:hypothetical protein
MSTSNHPRQDSPKEDVSTTTDTSKPKKPKLLKAIASYLVAQWIIFGLGLAILLAWAFPSSVSMLESAKPFNTY